VSSPTEQKPVEINIMITPT